MELYTKESLKEVIEKSKDEFYMPKVLFDHYKSLRLETKLAYVSILETMKNKAGYTTENTAYIKVDNPQIQVNLAILANKHPDKDHPYGHGRYEYIAGMVIAFLILVVGIQSLKESVVKIFNPEKVMFSFVAVVILIFSILVKLWMYYFNNQIGKN